MAKINATQAAIKFAEINNINIADVTTADGRILLAHVKAHKAQLLEESKQPPTQEVVIEKKEVVTTKPLSAVKIVKDLYRTYVIYNNGAVVSFVTATNVALSKKEGRYTLYVKASSIEEAMRYTRNPQGDAQALAEWISPDRRFNTKLVYSK